MKMTIKQLNSNELEREWMKSLPRLSDKRLLEIFPEAKTVIPEKIKEWKERQKEITKIIKDKLTLIKYKVIDEFSYWFWREWLKVNEGQKLLEIDGHIARLKRLFSISKGHSPKGITEETIQQALDIPIESIVSQHTQLRKSGKNLVGLCPFHQEKHPSFYIYPETNSCWCYGCNQGGNVINFIRLLYGFSFPEAVKWLIGEK